MYGETKILWPMMFISVAISSLLALMSGVFLCSVGSSSDKKQVAYYNMNYNQIR